MDLEIRYYTYQQLAQWFGVSYSYFRRKNIKEEKMQELGSFCRYQVCKGGVLVEEVFVSRYVKANAEKI